MKCKKHMKKHFWKKHFRVLAQYMYIYIYIYTILYIYTWLRILYIHARLQKNDRSCNYLLVSVRSAQALTSCRSLLKTYLCQYCLSAISPSLHLSVSLPVPLSLSLCVVSVGLSVVCLSIYLSDIPPLCD